jgi:hypothetical protein
MKSKASPNVSPFYFKPEIKILPTIGGKKKNKGKIIRLRRPLTDVYLKKG